MNLVFQLFIFLPSFASEAWERQTIPKKQPHPAVSPVLEHLDTCKKCFWVKKIQGEKKSYVSGTLCQQPFYGGENLVFLFFFPAFFS